MFWRLRRRHTHRPDPVGGGASGCHRAFGAWRPFGPGPRGLSHSSAHTAKTATPRHCRATPRLSVSPAHIQRPSCADTAAHVETRSTDTSRACLDFSRRRRPTGTGANLQTPQEKNVPTVSKIPNHQNHHYFAQRCRTAINSRLARKKIYAKLPDNQLICQFKIQVQPLCGVKERVESNGEG